MEYLYLYLVVINACGFLIMRADKQKAKEKAWRIPESVLMIIAAVGGSLGSLLGMCTFRHKTRHPKFALGIPALLILHLLLLRKIIG